MKILFISISLTGPLNASKGVAEALLKRGHEVVFAIDVGHEGQFAKLGFKEALYRANPPLEDGKEINQKQVVIEFIRSNIPNTKKPTIEAFPAMWALFPAMLESFKYVEPQIKNIINQVNPDVIINANLPIPCVKTAGIPWVNLHSGDPLFLPDANQVLPPGGSGYSTHDRSKWPAFRKMSEELNIQVYGNYLNWFKSQGASTEGIGIFLFLSKYLNLYLYPKELDYVDIRPLDETYVRIDSMVKEDPEVFEIPSKLKGLPGKLIYFSLGSMGSVDFELMKRLTRMMANSKHRFIVSKGLLANEYDLPDNMWGEEFLPQLRILPIIDLFITHGGNNSTTEGMYFGKPMIVLPLFSDQPDNAMRIKEMGFGSCFNPHYVSEDELLKAIEELLADEDLKIKLEKVSRRIKTSKSIEDAAERIEKLV